ncbi:MAG: TonB-dependent receptor plug domain-containing protein [Verrucomicrobia bacterium]|nr:TonB-dependent receptor plug domain-containing protein [Verrucomicrobiota bacterium]
MRYPTPPYGRLPALCLASILAPCAAAPLSAAEPARPPAPPPASAEVVELSPFEVNTTKDTGYVAENTLAGSRLNTSLRDTASSVSVFTKEFLDDVAITSLVELVQYSVNSEMNTNENQAGTGQNPIVNAQALTPQVLVRGLAASLGLDYFNSITPTDPYRVGRYEDTRGPNSILFGIGSPGGMLNQSSKVATLRSDSAAIRHSSGSWQRSRTELDANKILRRDHLAVSLAAVHQENGGWRQFDFQDKQRIFGSVTYRPTRTLGVSVMGEVGRDLNAVIRNSVESDQVLAWYDNRNARGVDAVTFTPGTVAPTAAQIAVGVTGRDSTRTGNNRRVTFIENDGTIFDFSGAFVTGSYNNAAVRAPDGTPGVTSSTLKVHDPSLLPYDMNGAGPGMFRDQKLKNYTISLDWQPLRDLAFNLAHNYQDTTALVNLMTGEDPTLRGDANRTLGVGGPANPYAGRLYIDGTWRRDVHVGDATETRLSASWQVDTRSKWFGRHRVAAMVSQAEQFDTRANSWLALAGRPFNATPNNANNRITVRNYFTEGSHATYRAGDWRRLPTKINFLGRDYGLVFANEVWGANNGGGEQDSTSALGVVQSHWLANRLVTTFGYRQDKVDIYELSFYDDPNVGNIVDRDRSKSTKTSATGYTSTAGAVLHVTDWLSLIGNRSTNQGVPSFTRKIFPDGNLAPASEGKGEDVGLGLDLLNGRLNAKAVYFTSYEQGRITTTGFGGAADRNTRVMTAFASVLVGTGRPYSQAQWDPIFRQLTPPATAASSDFETEGYEARLTANLTRNWRLVVNYSYTDSIRRNVANEVAAWYGLKPTDNGKLVQGVSQVAGGQYVVDRSAFVPGGAISRWLDLAAQHPEANVSTLSTSNSIPVAQEIFNLINNLNDDKEQEERRWGVRPHKISLFTAYDLREGRLKGFTVGGGWRWRSANVIGEDSKGNEITGRVLTATDLMLAYATKFDRLPGRVRFQVNISNLFDNTKIIPVRLATGATASDGFFVPGGRGVAYGRYDLVQPREIRFTTTWSY